MCLPGVCSSPNHSPIKSRVRLRKVAEYRPHPQLVNQSTKLKGRKSGGSHTRARGSFTTSSNMALLSLKSLLFLVSLPKLWNSKHQCPEVLDYTYCVMSRYFIAKYIPTLNPKQNPKLKSHCCESPYFLSCGNHLLI